MRSRRALSVVCRLAVVPAIAGCLCVSGLPPVGMATAVAAIDVSSGRGEATQSATHAASLESAATRAGETGRKVAISLIGLALAIAAVVLAFRRDFREAAAVFAVGMVCILLATPAGMHLLSDTVKALVGS